MRAVSIFAGILTLSACGVPSDPDDGPVVLLCKGEEVNSSVDGSVIREPKWEFYRIDATEKTIQTWDAAAESFNVTLDGLSVSAAELRYEREDPMLGETSSRKTIVFDRILGRVTEKFTTSDGGSITFSAPCKPVSDPISEKKF